MKMLHALSHCVATLLMQERSFIRLFDLSCSVSDHKFSFEMFPTIADASIFVEYFKHIIFMDFG